LALVLDYAAYEAQPLPTRVDWFDQLTWESIAQPTNERTIRRFLQNVYEQDASDYIRLKALEWYSELSLGNVIPPHAAMTFLRDATDRETYIQIAKLKYLFLLFGDDVIVSQELDSAQSSQDIEIASEAYYRKGLIHLLYRAGKADSYLFFEELDRATYSFNQAVNISENRVDASFFVLVTQCLKELLANQIEAYTASLQKLADILWQRQIWSHKPISDLFEWNIYQGLENIKALAQHTANEDYWHEYRKEFALLAKYFNDAVAVESLSRKLQNSYRQFADGVGAMVIDHYYSTNLWAIEKKINAVSAEISNDDPALSEFLLELSARIQAQQQKKKFEPNKGLIIKLLELCPELTYERVIFELKKRTDLGESEDVAIANLTADYAILSHKTRSFYQTGSPAGQQVFKTIEAKLSRLLINYPRRDFGIFLSVLSDIISYAHRASNAKRRFFPHLYDPSVKDEDVFQDHMYTGLVNNNDRASYYHYEPADRIGGGRIDITYEEEGMLFPIEVKKDIHSVDWQSVEANYLAQAQTYTLPYSQLGILVIFDISAKRDEAPMHDFKDCFEVLHLKPLGSLPTGYPDFIVAVIIYGNKISPSGYTNYSR
jgi:hypothetical protein